MEQEIFAIDGTFLPVQIMQLRRESLRRAGRGEVVTLDGTQHFDPMGAIARYAMTLRAEPSVLAEIWEILEDDESHLYTFPLNGEMVQRRLYAQKLAQESRTLTVTFLEVRT